MWKQEGDLQILTWRYGRIIITKTQPNLSDGFLVTTDPFSPISSLNSHHIVSSQSQKSLHQVTKLLETFFERKLNKSSKIYIKGGGLLLDLAGFATSIYMRGIRQTVYVPTTLLAMVDATVGGKTGVNFKGVKNLVGTINENSIDVLIWIGYLQSLTRRQFLNGMAEVIKMGIVYDQKFFQWLQNLKIEDVIVGSDKVKVEGEGYNILLRIVKKCIELKIKVVEMDLTETHSRKWLNFGHTLGHAIELAPGNDLKHGQCVSIGMVKACQLALQKGIIKNSKVIERLKKVLNKFQLPIEIPQEYQKQSVVQLTLRDKKRTNEKEHIIQFVMIEDVGKKAGSVTKINKKEVMDSIAQAVEIVGFTGQSIRENIPSSQSYVNQNFAFPGSKSLSLRMLFISSLVYLKTGETTKIINFLSSQDTDCMINSLKSMGFKFIENQQQKSIQIISRNNLVNQGILDVGNSGITARFILPLCCLIDGEWEVRCQKRMSERPNKTIIDICQSVLMAQVQSLEKKGCLPVKIKSCNINVGGNEIREREIIVPSKESSQFVSSLLINSLLINNSNGTKLIIKAPKNEKGTLVSESYILMTIECLREFGFEVQTIQTRDFYNFIVNSSRSNVLYSQLINTKTVQMDLSTLSYPYTLARMLGIKPPKLPSKSLQGDLQFYKYLQKLQNLRKFVNQNPNISGSQLKDRFLDSLSIEIIEKTLIISLDFNNCTDTFMTMAVYFVKPWLKKTQPFCEISLQHIKLRICNIANQRVKESNRISMTIRNLRKIGVKVQEYEDIIVVYNGYYIDPKTLQKDVLFETANDHRLAMSMAILATFLKTQHWGNSLKLLVDRRKAVDKTFPQFWQYLKELGCSIQGASLPSYRHYNPLPSLSNISIPLANSIILIGNRGSGKSTLGRALAQKFSIQFLDTDALVIEKIKNISRSTHTIKSYVETYGWNSFRDLQTEALIQALSLLQQNSYVLSTGGGIIQRISNRQTLKREKNIVVYLQRTIKDLVSEESQDRPALYEEFEQLARKREMLYMEVCDLIVSLEGKECRERQIQYLRSAIERHWSKEKIKPGFIVCMDQIPSVDNHYLDYLFNDQDIWEDISGIEFRVDQIVNPDGKIKSLYEFRREYARILMHDKLRLLPIILTLRTKSELGLWNNSSYPSCLNELRRIPTNYLDIQISNYSSSFQSSFLKDFSYNPEKILWSYHGSSQSIIQRLLQMPSKDGNTGMRKLCLYPENDYTRRIYQTQKGRLDMCWILGNGITRLQNKIQMVVPRSLKQEKNVTGIFGIEEMRELKRLFKLLKR